MRVVKEEGRDPGRLEPGFLGKKDWGRGSWRTGRETGEQRPGLGP